MPDSPLTKDDLKQALIEADHESESSHHDWIIDKKIPISLIVTILVQTFAFGWYASTLDGRIVALEKASPATMVELTKLQEARESQGLALQKHSDQLDQILNILHRQEDRATSKAGNSPNQ
jgi:hypothetical protein